MKIIFSIILQLFAISIFAATTSTTYIVDQTGDAGISSSATSGDLRYCVSQAIAGDIINFNISTGTAPHVITLTSDLVITQAISIDGASQPGFSGTPVISISGSASGYGFLFSSISNLAYINSIHFNNPGGTAITAEGPGNTYITGCYIGTDLTGNNYSSTLPPDTGIYVSNSAYVSVGQGAANVILSPNGIIVNSSASTCDLWYNNIGLNRAGLNPGGLKRALKKGIEIVNSGLNNIVGNNIGNCDTAAIVISNNLGNSIYYNIIGKDLGSQVVSNGRGIWIKGSYNLITQNTIVNSAIISGSSGVGIEFTSSANYNKIYTNDVISCNAGGGIVLNGGNSNYSAPTFGSATSFMVYPDLTSTISGTCQPSDIVDLYEADNCGYGSQGLRLLGTASDDDDNGLWSAAIGALTPGTKITAIARTSNLSSPFSSTVDLVAFNCKGVVKAIAGPNSTSCSNSPFYLNGSIVNATDGNWSSSGKGIFSQGISVYANSVNYTPSYEDIAAGSVKLTLTTTNAIGGCPDTSSSFILSLPIPLGNIFGGVSSVSACPNISGIPLDLKISNTIGGTWTTTGGGSFSPSNTALNATYIPDVVNDFGNFINITFTPVQPGACPPINGSLSLDFNNTNPVSNPAQVISKCSNYPVVLLPNNSGFSTTETWTNKGVPIKDSSYVLSGTTYRFFVPTTADLNSGSVTLIDKVSSPGCVSNQDTMTITYVKAPVVFAGDSSFICGNATSFSLSKAVVSNPSPGETIQWSGFFFNGNLGLIADSPAQNASKVGGVVPIGAYPISGTFKNDTLLNTIYYPSAYDRSSPDGVFLQLTIQTAGGACTITDNFPITFAPIPDSVMAGSDTTLCQGDSIPVKGLVSAGFPFKWSSVGTGKFLQGNNVLNTTYVPSQADLKKIAFSLILTGGNPNCPVRDELLLILLPKPDVGVGSSQVICPETSASLNAARGIDQIGLWTVKSGTGMFDDSTNNNVLVTNITASNNTYIWTITDTATGCKNTAIYSVNYCSAPPLKVFNALSPNNDGVGESLEIENIDFYKDNKVSIFNHWGDMVFKVDNYKNLSPDGTVGNAFIGKTNVGTVQELPNGSYYYLIDKGSLGGKPEKGFLVIQK